MVTLDFLEEEVRCGYAVSVQMKQVWQKEIELLVLFSNICYKYNLNWQMTAGSLLGVVRHKGFIPWDDDIDVLMPRKDYDLFIEVAGNELRENYFLQTSYTDPGRNIGYAQLRNSATTAIDLRYVDQGNKWNQGIFIDIFPLDYVSDDPSMLQKQKKKDLMLSRIYKKAFSSNYVSKSDYLKHIICKVVYKVVGSKRFYKIRQVNFSSIKPTSKVGLLSFLFDEPRFVWDSCLLEETVLADFEYLKVPIPKEYNRVLQKTYGEWNRPVKGAAMHEGVYFDCQKSYKDTLVQKFGYTKFN